MILSAIIHNGKAQFDPRDEEKMRDYIRSKEGKKLYFVIQETKPPRTLLQNAYLWGICYQYIAEYTGQSPEEVHAAMKERFLPRFFTKEGDKEVEIEKSTTRLTTKEFTSYIEQVRAAGAELGIRIPSPDES